MPIRIERESGSKPGAVLVLLIVLNAGCGAGNLPGVASLPPSTVDNAPSAKGNPPAKVVPTTADPSSKKTR